jgi:hypothetical protein
MSDMIVVRVLLSGFKLTPTSLGAGPSCSTFEVAVPSEPQTPRARSRSTQDARDRLHQDHRLRVPASASLSEDRTHYTGGRLWNHCGGLLRSNSHAAKHRMWTWNLSTSGLLPLGSNSIRGDSQRV